jgi:RNA polymerase sigma-70 factor, ECF subfamily
MEEAFLLEQIKLKNKDAFKEMVLKYQNLVINICYGFVHNQDDAQDIAQEVFIELYKSIEKFRQESKLSTWIYRISVNKSLNFIRDNKKNSWFQSLDLLFEKEKPSKEGFTDSDNPHTLMEKDEKSNAIYRAIDELPENQKISFVLYKFENLSYKEISEVMKISLSSVESLIFRAKKNLQAKLIGYYKKNI